MKESVPNGFVKKINFRKLEYLLKCPVRSYLNDIVLHDSSYVFAQAMDELVAYYTLRHISGETPTSKHLVEKFNRSLTE
jgi:hypothetical protein